jgi:FkbM family methyltransferase
MADKATFKQVFIQSQYKINFPLVPQTIIDGGANIGLATIYFSHLFPQASIVAVEPNTENFQQMEKNIKTSKNIYPIHGGIWNNNQHLRIVNSNVDDNAFMVEEVPEPTSGSIPAFSIDHLMQINNWSSIDLLKLDIEGSEKEVFEKNLRNDITTYQDFLNNIPKSIYEQKLNFIKSKTISRFWVKEYPTASATVVHFRALLNELHLNEIDYAVER